jgi:hypothetical protein
MDAGAQLQLAEDSLVHQRDSINPISELRGIGDVASTGGVRPQDD